ncbi:hypothetical protein GCM10010121_047240 [Streptomyces brasiliensis]|uniref:Uncharacterized protein n=1 Tax=Streptomyces brasiliensis TaxID=1954 RepID=A0A917KUX3_9ACTN|nr:hypothetical protein GCM10010121_047240 [Streptomyces brasiliensis]
MRRALRRSTPSTVLPFPWVMTVILGPPHTEVKNLARAAGIALDSPLGEHQFVVRHGRRIPVPGGTESLGVWNKVEQVWDAAHGGYTEVTTGSSYIQAVGWDRGPCPDAHTLLTYSQSSNPNSPHYSDQTRLFSQERWVTSRFCEKDIMRSPSLRVLRVSSR